MLLTEHSEILRIVWGRAEAAPSLRAVRVVRGRGHGRGGDHLEALHIIIVIIVIIVDIIIIIVSIDDIIIIITCRQCWACALVTWAPCLELAKLPHSELSWLVMLPFFPEMGENCKLWIFLLRYIHGAWEEKKFFWLGDIFSKYK